MKACHSCGKALPEGERVYRSSTCEGCGRDLKVCRNCRFYSPGSHWDCLESITDPVADKERANFCEFFQFRDAGPAGMSREKPGQAADQLRRLFGSD